MIDKILFNVTMLKFSPRNQNTLIIYWQTSVVLWHSHAVCQCPWSVVAPINVLWILVEGETFLILDIFMPLSQRRSIV
jgi:hypothetical protein